MTTPDAPPAGPMIGWCRDLGRAAEIARFFVAHARTSYISHSELQFGRAEAPDRWRADLAARVEADARRAIAAAIDDGAPAGFRCAIVAEGERIAGFAFVRFAKDGEPPFAIIEDLLIHPDRRGGGLGHRFLDWIAGECATAGCRRLFLESGLDNHRAHHFFEREGFAQTSIVMMREL